MTSSARTLMPRDKLAERKTGISEDAFSISSSCSGEYPVVARTTPAQRSRQNCSSLDSADGLEKSMTVSTGPVYCSGSEKTGKSCGAPSAMSKPAATLTSGSAAHISSTTAPIWPLQPDIMTCIMEISAEARRGSWLFSGSQDWPVPFRREAGAGDPHGTRPGSWRS